MMGPPSGTRTWLVAGHTDLRKGVDGLVALVQNHLTESAFTGEVYLFRGKSGEQDQGAVGNARGDELSVQTPERCEVRLAADARRKSLSTAQLSMLLEGIDWRHPKRTGLSPEDPDRTRPTRT